MKTQTALIQRNNNDLGRSIHYNLENVCKEVVSMELIENNGYKLALRETKEGQHRLKRKFLTGKLSMPLSYDLTNFVVLKHLYHSFDQDISFGEFYEATVNGLCHYFKREDLSSHVNFTIQDPEDLRKKERIKCGFSSVGIYVPALSLIGLIHPSLFLSGMFGVIPPLLEKLFGDENDTFLGVSYLFHKSRIFRKNSPHKKISGLSQKIIQLYNERERVIDDVGSINQHKQSVKEKLDIGRPSIGRRQMRDFKEGLRCTKTLSNDIYSLSGRKDSLIERIKNTEKRLRDSFDGITYRKGIHITVESRMENAREIITNFYKQLLSPVSEDFDIAEARKEIEEGWSKTKRLAKVRLK